MLCDIGMLVCDVVKLPAIIFQIEQVNGSSGGRVIGHIAIGPGPLSTALDILPTLRPDTRFLVLQVFAENRLARIGSAPLCQVFTQALSLVNAETLGSQQLDEVGGTSIDSVNSFTTPPCRTRPGQRTIKGTRNAGS